MIIATILLVFVAIQTDFVQNWLVGMVTKKLTRALGTEVSIKKVSISLFNSLNMESTMVRDKNRDTLLYAGQLRVRITDWFFLYDSIVLKYIGLEDATIKMQRKDSVWNYQFIADYFASPGPKKAGGKGINLDLKKADFKNVHFIKNDLWAGERMEASLGSLYLDADVFDLKRNVFSAGDLLLDKPFLRISSLNPLRPPPVIAVKKQTADTGGMYFNTGNLTLRIRNIKITNGGLFLDSDEDTPVKHFDGAHIQLTKLNGRISNAIFIKDTLKAGLDLAVRDRCGLEIKKLKTAFKLTPQVMELAALDLQTNRSRLGSYYAMHFKDFNKDFGHYIERVTMDARFKDARINSDDIAYFAPELKDMKKVVTLSGNYLGTVENFTVNRLMARIGNSTNVSGTLSMKGLPDINTTRINFTNGTLQTNYADVGIFIPAMKGITSPNLAALGTIIYRGNFVGTIHNFVTAGMFSTQLGGVKTDVSLQLPARGEPTYTGNIETNRFNIGKFLNDSALGLVDFKGKITGNSFAIETMKTTLDGTVSSLEYNNYTYKNIVTNGTFQKKYFEGEVKVNDSNFNFTSTVQIDLSKAQPSFNILGDLVNANLRPLHFTKDSIELTGLFDVNFSGTNIDNFLGTAKFLNATIKKNGTRLSFDSLNLSSYQDTIKHLRLASNDFNASIAGTFSIMDLPNSFQSFLNHYFPTYIKPPAYLPENQQFQITVNTNYIDPYLKLLDNKLSGFNDAKLTGSIDTRKNELRMVTTIPSGSYDNYTVTGIELKGAGSMDTLSLSGEINSIQIGDSLRFPNTKLAIVSSNDHSIVSIKTSADNTLNDADLYADVYTLEDGVRVRFQPSSFVLNNKKWNIEKEGELIARTHLVSASNIKFTQSFQEISVVTQEEDGGNTNNLIVKLKDVVLGDLTSAFLRNPRFEGITNGSIVLSDFFGKFRADAELKAEQFRMDDDSIGLVNIKSSYDSRTSILQFDVQSPNDGYRFNAKGSYNLKDSVAPLMINAQLTNSKIDILHRFLSDLFSDMTGTATGDLSFSGNPNSPDLRGRVQLRNASMKVNYTQVTYHIDSADIRFEEDGINFGQFQVRDRNKNTGTIKGKLFERGFKDMAFDFELNTDKLLLLDTKLKDNQQFYGMAIGSANLTLKGPETNAKMTIVGTTGDSSHLFIPSFINKESGNADFIVFKQYGTEMIATSEKSRFNLAVELDITADNRTQIDVILDDLAGDVIKATGNGRLRIGAGTTEPLTIRGRYNVEHGNYDFNLQGLVRKPFLMLPDAGNYIEWTGDPMKADVHIDAQYTAERVSLSDLIGNNSFDGAVKAYRGDVYVVVQLREQLLKPAISFKLDFPQGSPAKTNDVFTQFLTRIEKDENEMLNQVAFLIAFGSFSPVGANATTTNSNPYSFTSIGVNTLSQVLTKEINKVFSNILFKLTGDKSLRFDLGTSFYSNSSIGIDPNSISNNTNRLDRSRINFKLGKSLFNNNVIITFGGDLDFAFNNTASVKNGNFQWLPDLNIDIILSKDRKLRAIIFSKNSLDISNGNLGRRNRQGVSISYRRDFETLFGKNEKDIEFKAPAN